jgi:hypothetical protein
VLLTQANPAGQFSGSFFVSVDDDVFILGAGRVEAEDCSGRQPVFIDDAGQHFLGVGEQLAGRFANCLVVQNGRIATGQIPTLEERRPVDEQRQVAQTRVEGLQTELVRNGR